MESVPRGDSATGNSGLELWGDSDVEGEDVGKEVRVDSVERRAGRVDSNMPGRSVSTALLIASCGTSAGAIVECGDIGLGFAVVSFSVTDVVGERHIRLTSGDLGGELLTTTSHVNV
jgi:hypothetical protein